MSLPPNAYYQYTIARRSLLLWLLILLFPLGIAIMIVPIIAPTQWFGISSLYFWLPSIMVIISGLAIWFCQQQQAIDARLALALSKPYFSKPYMQ